MFMGLPDPLVGGMDPDSDPSLDLDPFIIVEKLVRKTLIAINL
jgi:hypothetical protein